MNNIKILSSLILFSEVAKRQSFTLAANKFSMSKSAVSQQIKRLEEHLGQQLLSRHSRGMSLTSAGKVLVRHCDNLRRQMDLAIDEVSTEKDEPTGSFALTVPHSFEKHIVIPALKQLCNEYPRINPCLLVSDDPKDLIDDNLDIGIYGGHLKDSSYRALPIGRVTEVLCVSPEYLQKNSPTTSIHEISNHRIIAAPWQNNTIQLVCTDTTENNISQINLTDFVSSNTLHSTMEMVIQGMGIGLLPEIAIHNSLLEKRLVRLHNNWQGPEWEFHMIHRFQGDKPVHIDRFYRLIKYYFEIYHNQESSIS